MISIYKQFERSKINLDIKSWLFPGGEVGIKLDASNLRYTYTKASYQTIVARIQNSNDLMELVMAKDALARLDNIPIVLILPYVPYSRQDRVCCEGESFSLKAFSRIINSLGFAKVITFDPHSAVTEAVFDNLKVFSQFDVVNKFEALNRRVLKGAIFVSPDAGANKKTADLAKYFGHNEFIRADKLRNLATGEIRETIVYADKLDGLDVVIGDDLIDGARTFIELAKVLKSKGANKVILYGTHGIFSKGLKVVFESGVDEIFTTNSFYGNRWPGGIGIERATVLNLEDTFSI